MPASLIDAESLLSVDVGTANTRALLFDVVDGRYRFIAAGQAPSTATAPFKDVGEGVRQAIENLQAVTGRALVNAEHRLVMPGQEDGSGVDAFVATISAGPTLKTVVAGLLADVSLESAQRLARTTYAKVVETLGMNDRRPSEEQIDGILRSNPDLIIITGGTDRGASHSVEKILEVVGLACYLLPQGKRPAVLYAGNQDLTKEVKSSLEQLSASLSISPNVRPSLDSEDLYPAQMKLAGLLVQIRRGQMPGVEQLHTWAGGALLPTSYAQGRVMRFLSQVYSSDKGVLSVDIGCSAATVAAAFAGNLSLDVYPQLGLGEELPGLLRYCDLDDIARWLPVEVPLENVRDYLYQKTLYPIAIPATVEDLAIEEALARQALSLAVAAASKDFPAEARRLTPGLLPLVDPIIAGGSVITHAPTLGQSLLILLDGLQPTGVTTLVLDQNGVLPALGAVAGRNTILPVQVIESGAFLNLATVIAPVTTGRSGGSILRLRLIYENGEETRMDVKNGALEIIPLPMGQTATLLYQPLHGSDLGLGPGRGGELRVSGGALGIVIDARGRPLRMPAEPTRRRELIKKWLWTVGG